MNPTFVSLDTPSYSNSADAISRRAYEIWEQDGRPDGCEIQHWLQAEKELGDRGQPANGENSKSVASGSTSASVRPPEAGYGVNADVRPLSGTRGAPAPAPGRDSKRGPAPSGERLPGAGAASGGQTSGAKRR